MNAPIITIPKEEAKEHYQEYLDIVQTRKEKYVEQLKQVYYHLSKGHKVLDIYEAFKQSGVNEQGEPKLAIVRADMRKCVFHKRELGAGSVNESFGWNDAELSRRWGVELPTGTFPDWKMIDNPDKNARRWESKIIERQAIQTKVPICPAHLLPSGSLSNYYILWEVSQWNEVPKAADPFLLKRINANAFIILAEWDLTEVEQAVIRGL